MAYESPTDGATTDTLPGDDADSKIIAEVEKNWDDGIEYLRQYHEDFEDNYRFLYKFEHYDDENANQRDRRRAKPRGRQTASKHRHIIGVVMNQLKSLSTRPVNDQDLDDMISTEDARWFMEYETKDRKKRFRQHLYRAVSLAAGAGAGALSLDVHYDLGPFPQVRPRHEDPRSYTWTPGWYTPTDDTCPWVCQERFPSLDEVERLGKNGGWKNTENLRGSAPENVTPNRRPNPLKAITSFSDSGPNPGMVDINQVRVLYCWYRFDGSSHDRETGNRLALPPDKHYLACPECDYQNKGPFETPPNPAENNGFCVQCHAKGQEVQLGVVDQLDEIETVMSFPMGHRLVIVAPDERRVFYDGPWPWDINGRPPRNIPLAWFQRYILPLEPWGSCDTAWDWSSQVICNALYRRGYEFVSQAGGIIITGGDGLWQMDGKTPFAINDKPISLAKWRGMGAPAVEYFQPHGMLQEIMPYMQAFEANLRADQGIADLQLSAQNTKDIPASTVAQLEKTGEIPQDDFAERCADELSEFLSVWYDIKRAVMTEKELVTLRGQDGLEMFQRLRGEQLPDADVIVEVMPSWREFDAERLEKLNMLLSKPQPLWPILMSAAGVPPSMVRQLTVAMAQMAAMQQPGAPTGGEKPPPPSGPERNGGSGQPAQPQGAMA